MHTRTRGKDRARWLAITVMAALLGVHTGVGAQTVGVGETCAVSDRVSPTDAECLSVQAKPATLTTSPRLGLRNTCEDWGDVRARIETSGGHVTVTLEDGLTEWRTLSHPWTAVWCCGATGMICNKSDAVTIESCEAAFAASSAGARGCTATATASGTECSFTGRCTKTTRDDVESTVTVTYTSAGRLVVCDGGAFALEGYCP